MYVCVRARWRPWCHSTRAIACIRICIHALARIDFVGKNKDFVIIPHPRNTGPGAERNRAAGLQSLMAGASQVEYKEAEERGSEVQKQFFDGMTHAVRRPCLCTYVCIFTYWRDLPAHRNMLTYVCWISIYTYLL